MRAQPVVRHAKMRTSVLFPLNGHTSGKFHNSHTELRSRRSPWCPLVYLKSFNDAG